MELPVRIIFLREKFIYNLTGTEIYTELIQYRKEAEQELQKILEFWMENALDEDEGGFIGKLDHKNQKFSMAPKGSVLNSRILWAFSSAACLTGEPAYRKIAERAFEYLQKHFIDPLYGGVYWTVDNKGNPLDTKKQVYALAFAIYGLSEYHALTNDETSREKAISIYRDIMRHTHDEKYGGYVEALSRDWKSIGDVRLSTKDVNERKSMNTHLHVLEAFAALYKIWPNAGLKQNIRELVQIFIRRIFSESTHHLQLFFDDEWKSKGNIISYGHDIEAAWLVPECTLLLDDPRLMEKVNEFSLKLTEAATEGLDTDGGLWYEYDASSRKLVKEKHSWPQAEAMIGFLHAGILSKEEKYYRISLKSWEFVKKYIHDKNGGEWLWGIHENYSPMDHEDKVGIWKCPYHNSRACIEVIRRIGEIKNADPS